VPALSIFSAARFALLRVLKVEHAVSSIGHSSLQTTTHTLCSSEQSSAIWN